MATSHSKYIIVKAIQQSEAANWAARETVEAWLFCRLGVGGATRPNSRLFILGKEKGQVEGVLEGTKTAMNSAFF